MNFEEFRNTKFFNLKDPLLKNHPDNPCLDVGIYHFSDEEPLMQYIYQYKENDRTHFVLIAKQLKRSKECYCIWWGQGGDECYPTLEEAEKALWENCCSP